MRPSAPVSHGGACRRSAAAGAGRVAAGTYVITDDGAGIAVLWPSWSQPPAEIRIIPGRGEAPDEFQADIEQLNDERSGFIHLAPFGAPIGTRHDPSAWRAAVEANELLPHQFVRRVSSLQAKGGFCWCRVSAAHSDGGVGGAEIRVAGGGPALAKTLREEWPEVVAKAIDLPRDQPRELAGSCLPNSRLRRPHRGRISGGPADHLPHRSRGDDVDSAPRDALPDGAVILATGGARGITAEVLHPLARPGVTLVLAGRSPLPAPEDPALAELKTEAALRAHLIAQARASGAGAAAARHRTTGASDPAQSRDRRQHRRASRRRRQSRLIVADVRNAKEAAALVRKSMPVTAGLTASSTAPG